MPATVKISVIYNPINQNNTFSSGDFIFGQVILEVGKRMQIQSLGVKLKGEANVHWSEPSANYSSKEKFFSFKKYFVREDQTHANLVMLKDPSGQPYSSVVAPGRHVYPFIWLLPFQNLPPTFKSVYGQIVYTLETKLSRSMHCSRKVKTEVNYVPRPDLTYPGLMVPQHGTKDKKMKLFTSGNVSMNIHIEKMGYYLGEGLKVLAEIQNNSSRAIMPKYFLYAKHSFFVRESRKLSTQRVFKEKGELIEPNSKKTVTKVLSIPPSLTISFLNCRIVKVEYRLKVYLDVPYAIDPAIKFPIVILPLQP